jgi:hypothetical protein
MDDIDARRCRSRSSQGRCQLVAEHVGYPHAHAWHGGDWRYQRGKTRPLHVLRWSDAGDEWPEPENLWRHPAGDDPPWVAYAKP